VAIRQVDGPAGAPWERPLNGALDKLVVESEVLAENPLGDPARRPLYVYRSPRVVSGEATAVASVYLLQPHGGQLDKWLARDSFEPTRIERFDALYDAHAEPSPECILVFVDAWTSLGGSQFLNSTAIGDYEDYLCDELIPFIDARYPTDPGRRAVAGYSSGGYGAMTLPMRRPGLFSGLASHAGDALFEACYLRDIPAAVRALRENFSGSVEAFKTDFNNRSSFDWGRYGAVLNIYSMAAAYSPDPDRPTDVLLPFDPSTGRLLEDVWRRWLEHDPVRMAPGHATALHRLKRIYLDAGRSDEHFLDIGAQAFAAVLDQLGLEHTLELFPGGHGGIAHRFPIAVRELLNVI